MADEAKQPRVRFVTKYARHHRTLHADGAWAAVTPQLEVQFGMFNDLRPMPDEVSHFVTPEGKVGNQLPADALSADTLSEVVREVDVTVVVSVDTAKNLVTVLAQMIGQIEDHIKTLEAKSKVTSDGVPEVS
ncbi:MAG: hypothetical protein ACREA9_08430 [Pyrinomonadaceae bacterium]